MQQRGARHSTIASSPAPPVGTRNSIRLEASTSAHRLTGDRGPQGPIGGKMQNHETRRDHAESDLAIAGDRFMYDPDQR